DEAPADGGVVDFGLAREGLVGFALHERRPRHRFDAAGNGKFHLAGADRTRRGADRFHSGSTKTIEVDARHAVRQSSEQQRHARHVAVVLAGLVSAAEIDFVELFPIHLWITRHQRPDWHRGEIVSANFGERAAVAPDRGADRVTYKDVARCHHAASPWARLVRACNSRNTSSSFAVGAGVSATFAANRTFQPVFSWICSRVTPGWMETTVISFVSGSGSSSARSVMSRVGPLVLTPS